MTQIEVLLYLFILIIIIILFGVLAWYVSKKRSVNEPEPESWVNGTSDTCQVYNFPFSIIDGAFEGTYNSQVLDSLTGATGPTCYDVDQIAASKVVRTCNGYTGAECLNLDGTITGYNGTGSIYESCLPVCSGSLNQMYFGYVNQNRNFLDEDLIVQPTGSYNFRITYDNNNPLLTKIEDRSSGMCLGVTGPSVTMTLAQMASFPECQGVANQIHGQIVSLVDCSINNGFNWYSVPSLPNITGTQVNHQQLVYVGGLTDLPTTLDDTLLSYLDTNGKAVYTNLGDTDRAIVYQRENGCLSNYTLYQPFSLNNKNQYNQPVCDYPNNVTTNCVKLNNV